MGDTITLVALLIRFYEGYSKINLRLAGKKGQK
jgi:hypothetical protein